MAILDRPTSTPRRPGCALPPAAPRPRAKLRPKDFRPVRVRSACSSRVARCHLHRLDRLRAAHPAFGDFRVHRLLCGDLSVPVLDGEQPRLRTPGCRGPTRGVHWCRSARSACSPRSVLLIVYLVIKGWGLLSVPSLRCHTEGRARGLHSRRCPARSRACSTPSWGLRSRSGWPPPWASRLAILTAVYPQRGRRIRGSRAVRVVVTAMSGVPAIVAGVFIYSFWVVHVPQGFSGFAGFARSGGPAPPDDHPGHRRGAQDRPQRPPGGVDAPWRRPNGARSGRWCSPPPASGLITAVLLGIAVALGETAPLLVTIFGNNDPQRQPVPRDAVSPSAPGLHPGEVVPAADIQLRATQRRWSSSSASSSSSSVGGFSAAIGCNRKIRNSMNRRRAVVVPTRIRTYGEPLMNRRGILSRLARDLPRRFRDPARYGDPIRVRRAD